MGDLKPIGSEKLKSDDKLKRILELTYYQSPIDSKKITDVIKETKTGIYGIVKEKDGFYVKKGLNESSLDYIGGLFMKNKNKFSSYNEALKKLEFLVEQEKAQENLQEATKYVLKRPKPQQEEPMPMPTNEPPAPPAVPDEKALSPGGAEDESLPMPPSDEKDSSPEEEADFKKVIQRLSGRLQEKLNTYKDKLESEDYKYVIKMILSAVDFDKLEETGDMDEILDEFFPDEEESDEMGQEGPKNDNAELPSEDELGEMDGMAALEELITHPFDDEGWYDDDDDVPEPLDFEDPKYNKAAKFAQSDIKKYENGDDLGLIDDDDEYEDEPEGLTAKTENPMDNDEVDMEADEQMDPSFSEPTTNPEDADVDIPDSHIKELDIDELADVVNTSVKETLSKYFE